MLARKRMPATTRRRRNRRTEPRGRLCRPRRTNPPSPRARRRLPRRKADSFLVTEYAKSAVAELNATQGEVGVICVQFHAAWKTEAERSAESAKDATATGRGKPVDVHLQEVKRFIGVLRDQVGIRYTK